jgi:mediator of RNA polymerase II transcription subunit 13
MRHNFRKLPTLPNAIVAPRSWLMYENEINLFIGVFLFTLSSAHLSFSFAFFVHGESTVCASMDIREHPPVRPLTEEYLNEVIKNTQHNLENGSLNDDEEKEDFNDINHNVSMQSVILAPFGLSAVLTGNRSENFEQFADKIINDWNNFYPMKKLECDNSSSTMSQLVEVISGESHWRASPAPHSPSALIPF